jgi:hypothetical protein
MLVRPGALKGSGNFGRRPPSASFSPLDLGDDLLGWWDASTLADGAVASWADVVAGYTVTQATSGARPVKSATSFGGAPGVTFDGIDDHLTLESVPFPAGADPSEIWAVTQQNALVADTSMRRVFGYGTGASAPARSLNRVVVSGVNRAQADSSGAIATEGTVDFSSRHVLRQIIGASEVNLQVDDVAASAAAGASSTATTRTRMGANTSGTAGSFWHGIHRHVLVTAPLSTEQATQLQTWALAQRMV